MTEYLNSQRPNPCKDCKERYISCQDKCQKPERLAWLAEMKKINENRRKYQSPAWARRESRVRRHK